MHDGELTNTKILSLVLGDLGSNPRYIRTGGKHAKRLHYRYDLPIIYNVSLHINDHSMSGFGNPISNSDEPWCI